MSIIDDGPHHTEGMSGPEKPYSSQEKKAASKIIETVVKEKISTQEEIYAQSSKEEMVAKTIDPQNLSSSSTEQRVSEVAENTIAPVLFTREAGFSANNTPPSPEKLAEKVNKAIASEEESEEEEDIWADEEDYIDPDFDTESSPEKSALPEEIENILLPLIGLKKKIEDHSKGEGEKSFSPLQEAMSEFDERLEEFKQKPSSLRTIAEANSLVTGFETISKRTDDIIIQGKKDKLDQKARELVEKYPEQAAIINNLHSFLSDTKLLDNSFAKPLVALKEFDHFLVFYKKFSKENPLVEKYAQHLNRPEQFEELACSPKEFAQDIQVMDHLLFLLKKEALPPESLRQLQEALKGDIKGILQFAFKNKLVKFAEVAHLAEEEGAKFPEDKSHYDAVAKWLIASEIAGTGAKKNFVGHAQKSLDLLSKLLYLEKHQSLDSQFAVIKEELWKGNFEKLADEPFVENLNRQFTELYLAQENQLISSIFDQMAPQIGVPLKVSRSRLSQESGVDITSEEAKIEELLKGHELSHSYLFIPLLGSQEGTLHKVSHAKEKTILGVGFGRYKEGKESAVLGEGGVKTAKRLGEREVLATVKTRGGGLTQNYITANKELQGKEGLMTGHIASWMDKNGKFRQGVISPLAEFFLDDITKIGSPQEGAQFCLEAAIGLKSMHDAGWAHQDIKPENIMVAQGKAYLTDFDTANNARESQTISGTETFFSPEKLIKYKQKNTQDAVSYKEMRLEDIFSLGATFYEILNPGKEFSSLLDLPADEIPPGASTKERQKLEIDDLSHVSYATYEKRGFAEPASDTLDHIVWQMVNPKATQRPRLDQVIQHLERFTTQ